MNERIDGLLQPFITLLQTNTHYCTWQQVSMAIETDETAQQLLEQFNQAKDTFAEAQRFGRYHPDYQTYQRALAQAKRELDQYPLIVDYKQAQKQVQVLLNQMSIMLGQAVSPHIIVPSDFFTGQVPPKKSCGSNCQCG
ncbi:MAG: YlbF family regulator [Culicoidibacterales bacterium]